MLAEFIDKILSLGQVEVKELLGRMYTTKGLCLVPEPTAPMIKIHTLGGILDFLRDNVDGLDLNNLMVHIVNPALVHVFDTLSLQDLSRDTYIAAAPVTNDFKFGQHYDLENFIIALQAQFVRDANVEAILKLVGNLADETVIKHHDDGITQQVTARTGIAKLAEVNVPNPVTLRPYRTFPEIDQPASEFVFRLHQSGQGKPPTAQLIEADGGRWRVEAMSSIKAWITDNFIIQGICVGSLIA